LKYITFCELTDEFLRLSFEERRSYIPRWTNIAKKHGIKVLFWGMPMGVTEHIVCVFETVDDVEAFIRFEREWLGLGTPEAGKFINRLRTITVY
jgi:hypothetical protein